MSCCDICCENFYDGRETSIQSTERCMFITDKGEPCQKNKMLNDSAVCIQHVKYRTPITCNACNMTCCKICYRHHVLTQISDPTCPGCKKSFDIDYLLNNNHFTSAFVWGALKLHRENILLDRFIARLPEFHQQAISTRIVRQLKERSDNIKKQKTTLEVEIAKQYKVYLTDSKNVELHKHIQDIIAKKNELIKKYNALDEQRMFEQFFLNHGTYMMRDPRHMGGATATTGEKVVKPPLTRGKCPKENCNAYIMENWKCGTCETEICQKCSMIKRSEHKCDPNDVLSVQSFKNTNEYRQCPKCGSQTHREHGCAQMWCIVCHTAFDWRTGEVDTGPVHNPMYWEWRRQQQGQEARPARANRMGEGCYIDGGHLNNLNRDNSITWTALHVSFVDTLRELLRNTDEILQQVNRYVSPIDREIRQTAIKYLLNDMTKDEVKVKIQRDYKRDKKDQLANQYRRFYADAVKHIITEAYYDFVEHSNPHQTFDTLIKQHDMLYKDVRQLMINLGKMFHSQAPKLMESQYSEKNIVEEVDSFMRELNDLTPDLTSYVEKLRSRDENIYRFVFEIICRLTNNTELYGVMLFLQEHKEWTPMDHRDKVREMTEEILFKFDYVPVYQHFYTSGEYLQDSHIFYMIRRLLTREVDESKYVGHCMCCRARTVEEIQCSYLERLVRCSEKPFERDLFCNTHKYRVPKDIANLTWDTYTSRTDILHNPKYFHHHTMGARRIYLKE